MINKKITNYKKIVNASKICKCNIVLKGTETLIYSPSRNIVLNKVWNYSTESDTHTVETHIHRLRKKILEKFDDNNFIKNNDKGYYI